jgi:hypothetical protein
VFQGWYSLSGWSVFFSTIRQFRTVTAGLLERILGTSLSCRDSFKGETMLKVRLMILTASMLLSGGAYAQSNEFATGNMHFDAKEMDTNGDHMITREEMIAYAEKSWDKMAQGKDSIPITAAAKDFASGGVNFRARAIDTDHDGTISKAEFVAFAGKKFDGMKKTDNMVSVDDMAHAIARGNTTAAAGKSKAKDQAK